MVCDFCSKNLSVEDSLNQMNITTPSVYDEPTETTIDINNLGMPVTDIANVFNLSKEIIQDNLSLLMESEPKYLISEPLNIKEWEPKEFKMESTTVWSFKNRGNWATHNGNYRGNWSPYIPRNLILRYSNEGDTILDPFLGSGTTLVETKLLRRKGIGIDINPDSIKISQDNLRFNKNLDYEPVLINENSKNISFIDDNSIDLICTHPPYANIIKYSEDIDGDLSHLDIDDFLLEMSTIARELFRVLKKNKYCAILIGDTRKNKHVIPLGFNVMQVFLKAGFMLKENIIKEQHNCQATGFWYKKSIEYNFLLIAHEYLFVFRKP